MPAIATKPTIQRKIFALVYQAGIANLFECEHDSRHGATRGKTTRHVQSDFRTCAMMARGLVLGGHYVKTLHCNSAGDVAGMDWSRNLDDAPFSDKLIRVDSNQG